jgi:hypothetical protein
VQSINKDLISLPVLEWIGKTASFDNVDKMVSIQERMMYPLEQSNKELVT